MSEMIIPERNLSLDAIEQIRQDKETLWHNEAKHLDLSEALEVYCQRMENRHTRRAKKTDLKQFVTYLKGTGISTVGHLGQLMKQETQALTRGFLLKIEEQQAAKTTIQRKKNSIILFFNTLHEEFPRLITVPLKINDSRFQVNRDVGVTEALSRTQFERLLELIEEDSRSPYLYPLCVCAMYMGGRRISEMTSLAWHDLDFERREFRIRPSKSKTDISVHTLPLHPLVITVLGKYKEEVAPVLGLESLVFPVSQQAVDKGLKRFSKKIKGHPHVSFHVLRTSFITWTLERGDSWSEIMNATLHKSPKMVRYYDRTSTVRVNSINKF